MSDEKEEKEPFYKKFFVRIIFLNCIGGFYFLMSPYQNCLRDYKEGSQKLENVPRKLIGNQT